MSDENNILSPTPGGNGKERLPEDKLMAYLEGKLPPHEQHEVELWLSEEGMESDAVEGLRKLDPLEARSSVHKLDLHLRKAVLNKKRARRRSNNDQFTWIAIAIILLLIVVAYLVIRRSI